MVCTCIIVLSYHLPGLNEEKCEMYHNVWFMMCDEIRYLFNVSHLHWLCTNSFVFCKFVFCFTNQTGGFCKHGIQ